MQPAIERSKWSVRGTQFRLPPPPLRPPMPAMLLHQKRHNGTIISTPFYTATSVHGCQQLLVGVPESGWLMGTTSCNVWRHERFTYQRSHEAPFSEAFILSAFQCWRLFAAQSIESVVRCLKAGRRHFWYFTTVDWWHCCVSWFLGVLPPVTTGNKSLRRKSQ